MELLRRALLIGAATLVGCYSPSLRDCTVTCAAATDCAGDQVCGSDGLCAAPAMAGQCATLPDQPVDAAIAVDAAPRPDAPKPVDAAVVIDAPPVATVELRVKVEGKGSVEVTGIGTCSSEPPDKGDCSYDVPTGVEVTARAVDIKPDEKFTRWASLVCVGKPALCTFTPFLFTSITAHFDHVRLMGVR